MKYGLSQDVFDKIIKVFQHCPEIESVYLYGSRARGDYKKTSDIDLAIVFKKSPGPLAKIKWDLDELLIIYPIDVLDYGVLQNPTLVAQIEKCKEKIYP